MWCSTIQYNVVELYTLAAAKGDCLARFLLGGCYLTGDHGLKVNFTRSLELLTQSADQRCIDAPDFIARLYTDTVTAAEQGNRAAQFMLGLMYELGCKPHVERDMHQANDWYQKSAAQLYPQALAKQNLSIMMSKINNLVPMTFFEHRENEWYGGRF